jgi:Putative zinc-finger
MTNMDHSEAVRLQAAEKYLLGELPREQHAAFEEHYFDCAACAEEMKATVAFLESARQVAREEITQVIDDKRLVRNPQATGGWFGWLRPAFAVPVFAALLLLIGYQNGVTIPNLKQAPAGVVVGEGAKSFSLQSADSRGESGSAVKIAVGAREDFRLDVDMPGNSSSGYTCQIEDESGKVLATIAVSAEEAKNTVTRVIRGGSLKPGRYTIAIFKGQPPSVQAGNQGAAAQKSFVVEFVP